MWQRLTTFGVGRIRVNKLLVIRLYYHNLTNVFDKKFNILIIALNFVPFITSLDVFDKLMYNLQSAIVDLTI